MADGTANAVDLTRILSADRVFIVDTADKETMLNNLVYCFEDTSSIGNLQEFRKGIFQREELMSTGIGLEIGVPHVRLASIANVIMALGICRSGIPDYESLDDMPIKIVCMIGAHETQHSQYIKTLARVSERLKDDDVHDALLQANDPEEAYSVFIGDKD